MDRDYMKTADGVELPEGVEPECLIADSFSSLKELRKLTHKQGGKSLQERGQQVKELIQGAVEGLKPKEGEEESMQNLVYVFASWLT